MDGFKIGVKIKLKTKFEGIFGCKIDKYFSIFLH